MAKYKFKIATLFYFACANKAALAKINVTVGFFSAFEISKGKDKTKASIQSALETARFKTPNLRNNARHKAAKIFKITQNSAPGSFWGSSAESGKIETFKSKSKITGGIYGIFELIQAKNMSFGLFSSISFNKMKLSREYDHHNMFLKSASPSIMFGPFVNFKVNKSFSAGLGVVAHWMRKKISMNVKDMNRSLEGKIPYVKVNRLERLAKIDCINYFKNKQYSHKTKFFNNISPAIIGSLSFSVSDRVVLSVISGFVFNKNHSLKIETQDEKKRFGNNAKVASSSFLFGIGCAYKF